LRVFKIRSVRSDSYASDQWRPGSPLSKSWREARRIRTSYRYGERQIGHERHPGYRDRKHGGPDRLLMFLVLSFVGMALPRAFVFFN
jgi:hypothetical protein